MKETIELPPQSYLEECFTYLPERGWLMWKERPRTHFKSDGKWKQFLRDSANCPAGIFLYRDKEKTEKLVMRIKMQHFGRKIYPAAHRLIFALKGIEIPEGSYIDHRNGDPFDNRWDNLRIATPPQNSSNQKKRNKTQPLPKGVSSYGSLGKYRVCCMANGRTVQKYGFLTPEAAHTEYCRLSQEMHGEFHRAS